MSRLKDTADSGEVDRTARADRSPRVLVVDDDPSLRSALQRSLAFNGYQVSVACDGAEALAMLGVGSGPRPHLVVLDIVMPRLDGLATTQALRSAGNAVPVLLLTARGTVADRVEGLEAGADDYLVKPFALDELLARVRALLRRATPAETPSEFPEETR